MNITLFYTKLNELAKVPYKKLDDAGYDLFSVENLIIKPRSSIVVKTGIALEIPQFHAGLIWPRSGMSAKYGIDVLAGVIDPSYRGEIMVCLMNNKDTEYEIKVGDKIAQIIIQNYQSPKLVEVTELSKTDRGELGFGSSGR